MKTSTLDDLAAAANELRAAKELGLGSSEVHPWSRATAEAALCTALAQIAIAEELRGIKDELHLLRTKGLDVCTYGP